MSTSSTTDTPQSPNPLRTADPRGPRGRARRFGLALGAVAVLALAAACGSGGGSNSSAAGSPGGGTVHQGPTSGGVSTVSTSLGTILTDSNGMTLYGFAADSQGTSNCDAQCLQYWPPVSPGSTSKAPTNVSATLGQITGTDGSPQLTVNGWPMYTYSGDSAPGDTAGQGLNLSGGEWWVVGTDGTWIKSDADGSSSDGSTSGGSSGYSRGGY
jgi:predicted lipoprotein with Yx(FWY)xxD motif